MNLAFTPTGWEDFTYWADRDRAISRKVRALLKEILRTPFEGTGKPEPLKYQAGNVWSRRITQEHRLVYAVEDDQIVVLAALRRLNPRVGSGRNSSLRPRASDVALDIA